MPEPRLQFWWEFGSTYSYLSVTRIEALAEATGVALEWKPFLLMPVLSHLGVGNPFTENAAKCAYMWTDLIRRAKTLGIPIVKPSVYPPNSLITARVATCGFAEDWGIAFTKAAFRLHWVDDVIIGSEENTVGALVAAGQDPEEAVARALTDENKAALKAQTDEAIAIGLFGAPSFVVEGEIFWGDDRLETALKRARGEL